MLLVLIRRLYNDLLCWMLKNSAMAGAITVATLALALTSGDSSHEHMVHCAITEAATKLISGIF